MHTEVSIDLRNLCKMSSLLKAILHEIHITPIRKRSRRRIQGYRIKALEAPELPTHTTPRESPLATALSSPTCCAVLPALVVYGSWNGSCRPVARRQVGAAGRWTSCGSQGGCGCGQAA